MLGGLNIAGKALKSASGWNEDYSYCEDCYDNNFNGTDAYGFSALPAGYSATSENGNDRSFHGAGRTTEGSGTSLGDTKFWRWNGYEGVVVNLYADYDNADYYSTYGGYYAFSVRCIKNTN